MARTRENMQGRRAGGSFSALPHAILDSPEYAELSPSAVKLLVDIFSQFRGKNNGDLCATWKFMRQRGWRSKETLFRALGELRSGNWLILTRQGSIHRASLFAVTWLPIDECKGKLDVSSTRVALNTWRKSRSENRATLPRQPGQFRDAA